MNIIIRTAVSEDLPDIFFLIKEFAIFQKTPEKVTITLEQMLEEKDFFKCLVAATNENKMVGFATFFYTYYSWSGKALYLDDLYVTAPYRKQNIGAKLLKEVIDLAKKEHCKKIRWQVSNWNENAIGFYKKMGASIDEVEINCDLDLTRHI